MNDYKYEQFIEKLLLDLPKLSKSDDLNFECSLDIYRQLNEVITQKEDEFFDVSNCTAREFLIFCLGNFGSGIEKLEIAEDFFHFANLIRRRKGLPVELTDEELEFEKRCKEHAAELRSEEIQQEYDNFKKFLNSGYNGDVDSNQQNESFW